MKRLQRAINRIDRTIRRYWFPLTLGFTMSGIFVLAEVKIRGRFAIGGEWLFPAFFCIIHYFVREYYREKARRERRNGRISGHTQTARK